jgi:hypothetical protein
MSDDDMSWKKPCGEMDEVYTQRAYCGISCQLTSGMQYFKLSRRPSRYHSTYTFKEVTENFVVVF